MKTSLTKAVKSTLFFVFVFSIVYMTGVSNVLADKSPANCTGSSLSITLYVTPLEAHVGDTITYSATVFNGVEGTSLLSCDASDITASITTPDGISHPLALSRTMLTDKQFDNYDNVVSYVARKQDSGSDALLKATASVTGTIHQNDTNSTGGGNQGLNVTLLATPIPPVADSGTSAGGPAVIVPPVADSGTSAGGPAVIIPPTADAGTSAGGPATPAVINPIITSTGGGGGCINCSSGGSSGSVVSVPAPMVVAIAPTFPNAGFGPSDIAPWEIALVLFVLSTSMLGFIKKNKWKTIK